MAPDPPPKSTAVCWLLILLAAGMVFGLNFHERGSRGEQKTDRVRPSAQELMTGRYAVGTKVLFDAAAATSSGAAAGALADEFAKSARTPERKMRAAVVLGEVRGGPAGRAALDAIPTDGSQDELMQDLSAVRTLLAGGSVGQADRDRLIERHGWFGELALARNLPPTDPLRARVLGDARRTALSMMAAGIGIILVIGVGLVLAVTGIVLLATRVIRFTPALRPPRHGVLLEAFTVYLVLMSLAMAYSMLGLPGARFVQAAGLIGSVALALWWPSHRGMSWSEFRAAIGLTGGSGIAKEVLCGIAGYIALLPVLAAGAAVTIFLAKQTGTDAAHPVVEALSGPLWMLLLIFGLAVIWAPITEELMFRGAFFGHARAIMAWPIAATFVGLLFAAIHPQGWAGIPVLAAIGFNLAVLRQWRGSIIAPIAAHALNNGTALTLGVMLLR